MFVLNKTATGQVLSNVIHDVQVQFCKCGSLNEILRFLSVSEVVKNGKHMTLLKTCF